MSVRNMALLVKPAKVPTWTKDMALEMFERQQHIWKTCNTDVPESTQFQDLAESLKLNREIKGLAKYVIEHILTTFNTEEKQKIEEIVKYLKTHYGRTRLEKLEELVSE